MRGDIVIVDFRPLNPAAKMRPAVIIQSDRYNAKLANTIIAQITSNVSRSHEDTQLLIDQAHADWKQFGLRLPSVINAANLATVLQTHITHVIGQLSKSTMEQVDECIKSALAL